MTGLAGVWPAGTAITPPPSMQIDLGYGWPARLNAVHMSLVPKGPYRGMVLVWGIDPVLANNPTYHPSIPLLPSPPPSGQPPYSGFRSYQPYAIVDPASSPANGIRYYNFLLPLGEYIAPLPPAFSPAPIQDFFCAGHAWSPFGDLIVVGGSDWVATPTSIWTGGRLTYVWNPRLPIEDTFAVGLPPYSGFGLWKRGPDLTARRWYPTATATHRLNRTVPGVANVPVERMLVLGGSGQNPDELPPGTVQAEWNSYEALLVLAEVILPRESGHPDRSREAPEGR